MNSFNSFNSINFIVGGIITNLVSTKLGLPNDPVSIMIGTTTISNLLGYINDIACKSRYLQDLSSNLFGIKRILGLSKYSIIINKESIFYQKIISYLLTNYKHKLIQDSIEHNYNIDSDITNIHFINSTIIEEYDGSKISIWLDYTTKDILVQSSTLDVYKLKKYVQSIVSKNTSSTYLNLFLPTIIHETGPSKKKTRTEEINNSNSSSEFTNTIVRWKNLRVHTNKNLANTILSTQVQIELVDDLNNFIASEEYYNTKGIPYKRGYLLYGPPGTGKTSIIKSFASTYGFDIYIINMENIKTPEDIVQIFRGFDSTHSYHIICFEDIDRCEMLKKPLRYYDSDANANSNIGIRTFLNELDGIVEGNKRITVFTANSTSVLESIEALCRPGRIDKKIEVSFCDAEQLIRIYLHYTKLEIRLEDHKKFIITQEEISTKKITPAYAVKIILSNPLITIDEFKIKLNIGSNSCNLVTEDEITNSNTNTYTSTLNNRSSRRSRHYKESDKRSFIKLIDMIGKEKDILNELVETISVAGTTKEIKEKIPHILWGRQTRVKSINKILETCKKRFKTESFEE
jgi:hypothetical protein